MISKDESKTINSTAYEFEAFRLEAGNLLLFRDSEIVPLAPKTGEVLLALVEAGGKLITKQELLDRVWAETFVEEANLTQHISALRKSLGEDKDGRKFIETIPRKGYRFIAEVRNGAKSETAEIVISERITTHATEETQIDAVKNENSLTDKSRVFSQDTTEFAALLERVAGRKNYPKRVLIFAVFCSLALLSLGFIFGNRLFSAKSEKAAVLPQAIISKRLMPDKDTINQAISPDGKFAVFTLLENGNQSIWQKNLATGETTQLTAANPLDDFENLNFRYSPDGQWIYFVRVDRKTSKTDFERMTATGGTPQKILENAEMIAYLGVSDYALSPDGREIAFVRDYGSLIVVNLETKIERVAAERDGRKRFGNPGPFSPAFSPDGKRLVVGGLNAETMPRRNELIEIDLADGGEKLIPLSEDLRIYQTEWLADGSGLIVTAAEATDVPRQIRYISYPDGKVTTLTNEDFGIESVRLSKDSRTMIADKKVGSRNLWTADAVNLNERKQITIGGAADQGSSSLALLDDGKLLFTSPRDGSLDVWAVMSDGSSQIQLTKNTGKFNGIDAISPDGRYLILNSVRSGDNQIWRVNTDGSNPLQLSGGEYGAFGARISPDGKWIYYTSVVPGQDTPKIYKVSIDGGKPLEISDRQYLSTPLYSPDGKLLFFAEYNAETETTTAVVIESATGKAVGSAEKLSLLGSDKKLHLFSGGKWTADSKHLLYAKNSDELWQYDVYRDKDEKIADFRPNTLFNFAASPDGKKFVFSLGNSSDETILLTNYLSETK